MFPALAAVLALAAPLGADAAEVSYGGASQRDPFTESSRTDTPAVARPNVNVESLGKSLQVTGISYSETNPKAIVNGKILGIGDEVGKIGRLTRIEIDGIAVQVDGKEHFFKQTMGKSKNDTATPPRA